MAKEVERKFLLSDDNWRDQVKTSYLIRQGYLLASKEKAIRIRLRSELTASGGSEPECFITLKFAATPVATDEFEYRLPAEDAEALFRNCGELVLTKTRHIVEFEGRDWEIDEFSGRHDGLVVAEIEGEDVETINKFPEWVGREVTHDSYFKNANLVFGKQTNGKE